MFRRLWIRFLVLAAASLTLPMMFSPRASASGTCSGAQGSKFDGYYQSGHADHPYEGVSAYMVVRDGNRCSGVANIGNFVDAWVMIASQTSQAWAQVGFERSVGDSSTSDLRWFSQFNDGKGHVVTRYSTFTVTTQLA